MSTQFPLPIKRVFFVDDSEDECFLATYLFQRARVHAELVHFVDFPSFEEHLQSLTAEMLSESLIVVDLNLTVSKGTDGVLALRAHDRFKDVVMGVCSGSDDPADRQAAALAGADFFVGKPLDLDALTKICASVPTLTLVPDSADQVVISRST